MTDAEVRAFLDSLTAETLSQYTDAQLRDVDYLRCSVDFWYWLAHYGCIVDERGERDAEGMPTGGRIIGPGIDVWPDQRDYLERYIAGQDLIVGKSRQVGVSWLATNADVWDFLFHDNTGLSVIAQTDDYAIDTHVARARWVYEQQPEHLRRAKPVHGRDNKHRLGLSNGSVFEAFPCTAAQARGVARKRIRLEELAFWPDADAVLAAVTGATRDGGQVVIISTGNGDSGPFYATWQGASRGENRYHPVFLGWRANPNRPDNFRDGYNARELAEFAETADEMFLGTGTRYYNRLDVDARYAPCEPVSERDGWRIYAEPLPGRLYSCGVDPADTGTDYCSADILDAQTGEQVAHYEATGMNVGAYCDAILPVAMSYGALLTIERENHGHAFIERTLTTHRYPNVYVHDDKHAGHPTNSVTRGPLLEGVAQWLADASLTVHDSSTHRQLAAFAWIKNRPEAPEGEKDDGVFSLAKALVGVLYAQRMANLNDPSKVIVL